MICFIENEINTNVKIVQTNNAKALCEGNIFKFYNFKGILYKNLALIHPNKMGLLKESISIFLKRQDVYNFNIMFLLNFGVNVL